MLCFGLEPGRQNGRRRWIHWALAANRHVFALEKHFSSEAGIEDYSASQPQEEEGRANSGICFINWNFCSTTTTTTTTTLLQPLKNDAIVVVDSNVVEHETFKNKGRHWLFPELWRSQVKINSATHSVIKVIVVVLLDNDESFFITSPVVIDAMMKFIY